MAIPLSLPLLALAACGKPPADTGAAPAGGDSAPPADSAPPQGDTAPPVDSAPPQDTGDTAPPPACALLEGVSAPAAAAPGEVALLDAAAPAAAHEGYLAQWTVPYGELSEGGAGETHWSLPLDVATWRDERIEVSLTASADGCPPESASWEVAVSWPEGRRVVVVYNPAVEGSLEVAGAYAGLREVPDDQLCAIASDEDTTLPGDEADAWLAALQACLDAAGEQVFYVVPVFGVPYRVSGRINDIAYGTPVTTSLDALMVLGGYGAQLTDAIYNPLYQDGESMAGSYSPRQPHGDLVEAFRDTYGLGIWMVARIDGADADAALALVERAGLAAEVAAAGALAGTVYVDGRYGDTPPTTDEFGSYEGGEWNMWGTRYLFEELGWYEVVWDGDSAEFGTAPAPTACPGALYYAGWYSYYNYNDAFEWTIGAIGGHLDSCSACDLRSGTWAAEALQRGITATFGAVNEPYVAGMPEYDQLFRYLTEGASYGEAAYQSTVVGAWMMTWIGDPLYRPYP